jgi:HPt (histidine-containing phosphotransfer) domain-containing protein
MNTFEQRVWWAVRPQWFWRMLRLGLRTFWISAALSAAGWLAARSALPPAAHMPLAVWVAGGFALFVILLPVIALWPISMANLARRLDVTFKLADRLTTAHEVAQSQTPQNYLEARLLHSSRGLLTGVRSRLLRAPRVPWVDFELSLLAVLAIYACYLLSGAAVVRPPNIPGAAHEPPPPLAAEVEVPLPGAPPELNGAPDGDAPGGDGEPTDQGAAQQAMEALAEALSEQSITQSAGAALAQGDTSRAAEALRELADQAGSLSEQSLEALAESLREAAQETQGASPEAAEAINEAANALQGGDPSSGLEDLAQLVEQLDEALQEGAVGEGAGQGGGAGSGGSTGRETQTDGSTERLQGESEVVDMPEDELPPDEEGILQPPQDDSEATEQRSTPYTHTGATGSGGTQAGDPLTFPWRLRDVVQRYFSPR